MTTFYCFRCLATLSSQEDLAAHKAECVGSHVREVACLVCLDQGEVDALGQEGPCPRGCKSSRNPLDTETPTEYSLEESDAHTGERDEED